MTGTKQIADQRKSEPLNAGREIIAVAVLGWHDLSPVQRLTEVCLDLVSVAEGRHDIVLVVGNNVVAEAIVTKLRASGNTVPVLALVDGDLPSVLGAGADDAQPIKCDPFEIRARLEAVLRRAAIGRGEIEGHAFMDIALQDNCVLVGPSGDLCLPRGSTIVLDALMGNAPKEVSHDTLMGNLAKGGREPSMRAMQVQVCKLRKHLRSVGSAVDISVSYGSGYRLVGVSRQVEHPFVPVAA